MKKIFLFLLIIVSVNSFGQNPPGYQHRVVRERIQGSFMVDSGLHIPRYNGLPVGVRGGASIQDGALAMDTTNSRLYIYSGGAWIRLAGFSEVGGFFSPDQTSTGTTTHDYDGNDFNHDNTGDITYNPASGKSFQWNGFGGSSFVGVSSALGFSASVGVTGRLNIGTTNSEIYSPNTNDVVRLENNDLNVWVNNGDSRLQLARTGGIGAAFLSAKNFAGTSTGSINISEASVNVLSDKHIGVIATDSLRLASIGSAGAKTPFYIDNLRFSDTATYVMGLEIAGYNVGGVPSYKAVLQDKSVLGGGGGVSAADLPLRITGGTTVSADTSVAYNPSLTTNQRLQKIIDSLAAAGAFENSIFSQSWYKYKVDVSGASQSFMYISASGTAASVTVLATPPYTGWPSTQQFQTGSTSAGLAYGHIGNSGTVSGIAFETSTTYNYGVEFAVEDLSDGTETYALQFGFGDHTTEASIADGVWFWYTHGDSSGKLVCKTRKTSGSTTAVASNITLAADTRYFAEISVYNNHAYFYINKVLVADITTNIPNGLSETTSIVNLIKKTNGSTARKLYVRFIGYGDMTQ